MKTVSKAYDSYAQARAAVHDLERADIPSAAISLLANRHATADDADVDEVADAATDVGISGARGDGAGLLAGIGLLAIPGLGRVVAAGRLPSTAVGVAVGAAAGGIVGALVDAGIHRDHAAVYAEAIRRGGTLVTARVRNDDAASVESIMACYQPIDPVARGAQYRSEGWTTFDAKAPAYRPSQAEVDRMRANWPN